MKNPTSECRKRDFRLFAATRGRPPMRGVILRKRFRLRAVRKIPGAGFRSRRTGRQASRPRCSRVRARVSCRPRPAELRACCDCVDHAGLRLWFVSRLQASSSAISPKPDRRLRGRKVAAHAPVALLCPLFAVCCSPPTLRPPPQSVARCLLFAACCPWFVACCLCLLFALRCPPFAARPPPSAARCLLPVVCLLLPVPTVRPLLPALRCPPSAARPPLPAVRCPPPPPVCRSLFAARGLSLVACAYCSPSAACYSLPILC